MQLNTKIAHRWTSLLSLSRPGHCLPTRTADLRLAAVIRCFADYAHCSWCYRVQNGQRIHGILCFHFRPGHGELLAIWLVIPFQLYPLSLYISIFLFFTALRLLCCAEPIEDHPQPGGAFRGGDYCLFVSRQPRAHHHHTDDVVRGEESGQPAQSLG